MYLPIDCLVEVFQHYPIWYMFLYSHSQITHIIRPVCSPQLIIIIIIYIIHFIEQRSNLTIFLLEKIPSYYLAWLKSTFYMYVRFEDPVRTKLIEWRFTYSLKRWRGFQYFHINKCKTLILLVLFIGNFQDFPICLDNKSSKCEDT